VTTPAAPRSEPAAVVEVWWRAHASRVHAYACRHGAADWADDVVSETFLVAFRRFDAVPDEPVAWLCQRRVKTDPSLPSEF
jgi:DNA-directed RNA polymerase specialized sigma24 family protein